MGFGENALELIEKMMNAKLPNWSEKKRLSMASTIFEQSREYILDLGIFRSMVKSIIEDENFRFDIGRLINRIKQSQGIKSGPETTAGFDSIRKYLFSFTQVSVKKDYRDRLESQQCVDELRRLSSYLANTALIVYHDGNSDRKRYLTEKEYEYISTLRMTNGTGILFPYNEVKIQHADDAVMEDASNYQERGAVPAVAELLPELDRGDEDFEPDFEFEE